MRSNRRASTAVDGKFISDGAEYCSQTAEESEPWWQIQLDKSYTVRAVRIFSREATSKYLRVRSEEHTSEL